MHHDNFIGLYGGLVYCYDDDFGKFEKLAPLNLEVGKVSKTIVML